MYKNLTVSLASMVCIVLSGCGLPGSSSPFPVDIHDYSYNGETEQLIIGVAPRSSDRRVKYEITKEFTGGLIYIALNGEFGLFPQPDLGPIIFPVVVDGIPPGDYKIIDRNFPDNVKEISISKR